MTPRPFPETPKTKGYQPPQVQYSLSFQTQIPTPCPEDTWVLAHRRHRKRSLTGHLGQPRSRPPPGIPPRPPTIPPSPAPLVPARSLSPPPRRLAQNALEIPLLRRQPVPDKCG